PGDHVTVAVVDRIVERDDLATGPSGGAAALAQRRADRGLLGTLDAHPVAVVHVDQRAGRHRRGQLDRTVVGAGEAGVVQRPEAGAVVAERAGTLGAVPGGDHDVGAGAVDGVEPGRAVPLAVDGVLLTAV